MAPEPASLVSRTPAFLVDQLIVLLVVVVPAVLIGIEPQEMVRPGQLRRAIFLVLMAVAFVYHFFLEWQTDQTIGKQLFGLRVVEDDGSSLGAVASFLRNALRLIDGLGYWSVAVGIILVRGDGKRLGDVIGHTLVVNVNELEHQE